MLFVFICLLLCKEIHFNKKEYGTTDAIQVCYNISEDTSMKEGCIISEFNQCGLFLCQKGQAEILLGGRPYQINKRNLFIYTAANLLQIRQRSADLKES